METTEDIMEDTMIGTTEGITDIMDIISDSHLSIDFIFKVYLL
jgi:hypothetical protein